MSDTPVSEVWPEIWQALGETSLMVSVAFLLTLVLGTALGIVLHLTSPRGLTPARWIAAPLGAIVNVGRSLPFIILLIAVLPLTRWIVGTAIGPEAAIVPLTIGSVPFFGRVVQGALDEVATGTIEAAHVMGARTGEVVRKVLLPEAAPGLVAGSTLTLVMLIGYSAMAGTIGGGGLGDLALRYGYQRSNMAVLFVAVAVLIVLVQLVQSSGDLIGRAVRRHR